MVRSLNSHPDIACFGELLKPNAPLTDLSRLGFTDDELRILAGLRTSDTAAFVDMIFNRATNRNFLASGLKLFYYHARGAGVSNSLWKELSTRDDLRVIHLYRQDLFAAYLSRELASATNRWHHAEGRGGDPDYTASLTIDVKDYFRFRQRIINYIDESTTMLSKSRTVTLTYEDFTGDFDGSLELLQTFLQVPLRATKPPLAKQAQKPWQAYVQNIDEVEAALNDLTN